MSLRSLRLKAGLTQTELSLKVNVDQSCISHWERGASKPCRKYRKPLALALDVSEEVLEKELG